MNISFYPKQQYLVNAILVMFIVHSVQLGVGVQGFQRVVFMEAGHDAWISVILSGFVTNIIAFIMVKTLNAYESSDLYGIHRDLYGKWFGTFINIIYIVYCLSAFLVILRNYIEVIQAWVFPEVPTWFIALTLLLLVIYGALGGFRVIVGISFFSVFLSLWLLLLMGYPLKFSNWENVFPLFESNVKEIIQGAHAMTFTVIGFELVYSFYPYIKEKRKVHKFMQIGLVYTTILYLAIMLVSLSYFSGGQLERTIWGTLSLLKIVRLPFIERFEYVGITFWMLIILPNLMLYLWSATRGMGRVFQWNEKRFMWIFCLILLGATLLFTTRDQINFLNDYFARVSFYIVYCYPIVLYMFVLIKKRLARKDE
ncbi:spore germination protein [Rossellomorea aquimaris]|uniref:GerAB/ArcD/ProY family transporter n=1 Tax=Rossellomorea aquimaris TaxID=189382 RepID=UPI001CD7EA16|nr:GerAB/ArcD/ProY family transporter [Rossellomorea aquimaris]MCA1053974.1 spore germination protein [Rossellomorea aquimaris]